MFRKQALVSGETYHIYNRGAHKQRIFTNASDYSRFSLLLHLANSKTAVHLSNLLKEYQGRSSTAIFEDEKIDDRLVEILAYSLMPNHFHLVLRQKEDNGIAIFMKKLATGYSMYFNTKYEHSGTLFQGRFKSSYIDSEEYFRYIFAYVHLNPLEIFQPGWKLEGIKDKNGVRKFLLGYPYSSFADYPVGANNRSNRHILSLENVPDFLKTQNDLEELLVWQDSKNIKDGPR
ncbi:MAG TPA: transposase [Candidatus Paceibacterota bacterium]|nr:transposase [Candidatus Paceibacterota bacterium]